MLMQNKLFKICKFTFGLNFLHYGRIILMAFEKVNLTRLFLALAFRIFTLQPCCYWIVKTGTVDAIIAEL